MVVERIDELKSRRQEDFISVFYIHVDLQLSLCMFQLSFGNINRAVCSSVNTSANNKTLRESNQNKRVTN